MEHKKYLFRVVHPVHGEAEVEAIDRYWATIEAAKEWGIRWSTIARECKVTELGPAPIRKHGRKGSPGWPS